PNVLPPRPRAARARPGANEPVASTIKARGDERRSEKDGSCGQGAQRDLAAARPLERAELAPRTADGCREAPLDEAQPRRVGGREEALDAQRLRLDEEAGQRGEAAPREREPEIRVKAAAEELEVVRRDEERARRDEEQEPPAPRGRRPSADRDRGRERDGCEREQRAIRDARSQRASVQLVERVRGDSHREEERGE